MPEFGKEWHYMLPLMRSSFSSLDTGIPVSLCWWIPLHSHAAIQYPLVHAWLHLAANMSPPAYCLDETFQRLWYQETGRISLKGAFTSQIWRYSWHTYLFWLDEGKDNNMSQDSNPSLSVMLMVVFLYQGITVTCAVFIRTTTVSWAMFVLI
jgi:hypothetical protein